MVKVSFEDCKLVSVKDRYRREKSALSIFMRPIADGRRLRFYVGLTNAMNRSDLRRDSFGNPKARLKAT